MNKIDLLKECSNKFKEFADIEIDLYKKTEFIAMAMKIDSFLQNNQDKECTCS